jgi:hypothetical protein
MHTSNIVAVAFAALAMTGSLAPALADSTDATCQVRKDGETKHGASGPCSFSQRQGYIYIDLRNGDIYNLSPGSKSNHYKDQKGIKVIRTQSGGNSQEFKWEGGKKITVTFAPGYGGGYHAKPSYRAGDTAPDLADLVGARAGQAESDLQRRGYVYTKGSTSGDSKYGNWYNQRTGECVTIRTADGRYQSIVQAPPFDCGR